MRTITIGQYAINFLIKMTKRLNNNAYERRKRCKRIKRNEHLINTFCNRPNKKKSLITNQSLPPTLPSFISQTISTTKFYSRSCSSININITRRLTVQNPKRTSSHQAKNLTCVWRKVCTPCQHSIASQVLSGRDWYHPHWGQSLKLISDGWSSHIVLHSVTYGIPMVIYAITTMSREHRYIHHLTARGMLCLVVILLYSM